VPTCPGRFLWRRPPATDQPAATQPLRIVLDRVDHEEPAATRRSPQLVRPHTNQPPSRHSPSRLSTMTSHSSSTHRPASPTCRQPAHTSPCEGEIQRLRKISRPSADSLATDKTSTMLSTYIFYI